MAEKERQVIIDGKEFAKTLVIASDDENEVCGWMIGKGDKVTEIVMLRNEKPSPYYFEVSAESAGKVVADAWERKLDVIGVIHSHPQNHPNPSATDFRFMLAHPGIWTIYSVKYKTWSSWIRIGDEVKPVKTTIEYD